ncbi:MAG: ATPase domain-containing protein [Promethearchaeota archaeon]
MKKNIINNDELFNPNEEFESKKLENLKTYWDSKSPHKGIRKLLTGIRGLDEVLEGGIPYGRSLLISGATGTGKTVFLNEFIYRGIKKFMENGVFVTFEENQVDIILNVKGFGWDYESLLEQNKLIFVNLIPKDFVEISQKYDLTPMIERIKFAIKKIGAKRVAIDNLGTIFQRFSNKEQIRWVILQISSELKRLGVTSMISAEKTMSPNSLSISGVQEYVADGVIDLSIEEGQQKVLRKMNIRKLRGMGYRSGVVSFVINNEGIQVFPKIPLDRTYAKTDFNVRKCFGIEELDTALGGGIPQGHMILIGGNTGTGKTLLGLSFLINGFQNDEGGIMVALEEPIQQVKKSAENIGWDLHTYENKNKLVLINPSLIDIEPDGLLYQIINAVNLIKAKRILIDSISSLESATMNPFKLREFLIQLSTFLKTLGITAIFTYLTTSAFGAERGQLLSQISTTDIRLSSIMDGIIILRFVEREQKVMKLLNILKLRGSQHKKEIFKYEIQEDGFHLGEKFKTP